MVAHHARSRDSARRHSDTQGAKLPIFPSRTGGMLNASNLRSGLLNESVKRVNERREEDDRMLLPEKVTPHAGGW
jgi:hypothetical protein